MSTILGVLATAAMFVGFALLARRGSLDRPACGSCDHRDSCGASCGGAEGNVRS